MWINLCSIILCDFLLPGVSKSKVIFNPGELYEITINIHMEMDIEDSEGRYDNCMV